MSVDVASRRNPRQFIPVDVYTATVESVALAARETAGVMIALDSGTIADGTHTPKLQDSADAVIWTDVPFFELQGSFSDIQSDTIQKVGYRGRQPFIRLVVTVSGATLGGVYGAYLDRAKPGIIGEYDLSTINVLQGPEFLVAPNAREWDGASFNKHEGVISNVVDGRNGTLSFWFKKAAGDQGHVFQMGPLVDILMGDQEIFVRAFQTGGGSQQVVVDTGLTGWTPDVWNHYMVSWENTFPAAAANVTQYLNGVELINGVNGVTGFAGGLDVDLGYAGSDMWEGTGTFELDNLEVCLSEFYLNLEERFDLTDADNRAQFRSLAGDAVNIGGDGSGATGTQPAFYAANGELNPNAGTSDDLSTVTGKILNCLPPPVLEKVAPPVVVPPLPGPTAGLEACEFVDPGSVYSITVSPSEPDGTEGRYTGSFWFKLAPTFAQVGVASFFAHNTATGNKGQLQLDNGASTRFIGNLIGTGGGQPLFWDTPTGDTDGFPGDGLWHHLMWSFDVDAVAGAVYLDGVDKTDTILNFPAQLPVDWEGPGAFFAHAIGGSHVFGNTVDRIVAGSMSEYFFAPNEFIDLSIEANRLKFRTAGGLPEDLGADGSTPLGAQPAVYLPDGDPTDNVGRWANYVLVAGQSPPMVACVPAPGPAAPAVPFVSEARDFQVARIIDDNGPVVSQVDGRLGTLSFWFNLDADGSLEDVFRVSNLVGQQAVQVQKDATNRMKLFLIASTSNLLMEATTGTNTALAASGWQHFMCSWDHAFPLDSAAHITCYLDGVLVVNGVGGANIIQGNFDLDIAYNARGQRVLQGCNANLTPSDFFNGCISNLYLNIAERVDLTLLANRDKFRTAGGLTVDLGEFGETPTGSQPFLFAPDGDLQRNKGSGVDLVLTEGTIVDCADAPPTS